MYILNEHACYDKSWEKKKTWKEPDSHRNLFTLHWSRTDVITSKHTETLKVLGEVNRGINHITLPNSKQANSLDAFSSCGSCTTAANGIEMTANFNDVEQSVYFNSVPNHPLEQYKDSCYNVAHLD